MIVTKTVPMLAVHDLERALAFYHGLLGFEITHEHREEGQLIWCVARAGQTEIMFQRHPRQAARNGGMMLYVYTDDIHALQAKVAAGGYRINAPAFGDGRWEAELADDGDGNAIMLCQIDRDHSGRIDQKRTASS